MIHQVFICTSLNRHIAFHYMYCTHNKNYRAFLNLLRHITGIYRVTTDIYMHLVCYTVRKILLICIINRYNQNLILLSGIIFSQFRPLNDTEELHVLLLWDS